MSSCATLLMMKTAVNTPYHLVQYGALSAYRFPLLAETTHAVFTRLGGQSPSPWHSLNMGHAVGDSMENVAANFKRACAVLALNPAETASCHLIHGNDVIVATRDHLPTLQSKADALITREPGLMLTMRFADCTPLLFYDPTQKAVGLGHAGWRGTMQNVVGSVVSALEQHFGSCPADLRLVIGPSIGPCCYQVGDDVYRLAERAFINAQQFFVHDDHQMRFDMWQANAHQARQAGVGQVVVSELCTACNTDMFFSHRAEKGRTGRFGAFIGLPAGGN